MVFTNMLAVLRGKLNKWLGLKGRMGSISILLIEATILKWIDVFRHFDCLLALPRLS
jgi:hypothetical protein